MKISRLLAGAAVALALAAPAHAQSPGNIPTQPFPQNIAVPGTFQLLFAAGVSKKSLTIENNNTSGTPPVCSILIGGPWQVGDTLATSRSVNGNTVTAAQGSIALTSTQSYTRYQPFIPSDQFLITCAAAGSVYVDIQ